MSAAVVHEEVVSPERRPTERPRVLVLTRNYPSVRWPRRGLWARRLVEASAAFADPTVVAPVPMLPPRLARGIEPASMPPRRVVMSTGDVWHPRSASGITYYSHAFDPALEYATIRRLVARLHAERPFDLLHAHFMYPDGVLCARLGRELGIPVVTTEHTFWGVWRAQPRVWRQIDRALAAVHTVSAVSEVLRCEIAEVTAGRVRTAVLPNLVEEDVFAPDGAGWDGDELLFVGLIRRVKGLDLLLRALATLARSRPRIRLTVLGAAYLPAYRVEAAEAHRLAAELGVSDRVVWAGERDPAEVAAAMRRAAVVVVPSRRETFCSVAVEALACGTPVVATRSGGPEEVMPANAGCLVPVDDVDALVEGIEHVLHNRDRFDPAGLRASVVSRFGRAAVAERIRALYASVISPASTLPSAGSPARARDPLSRLPT